MKIAVTEKNQTTVVALEGKLDTNASADFEAELNARVDAGASRILVDLGRVDFITSSGLRVLLATAKRLRISGGELFVCSLNKTVREVFDISGIGSLLRVYDSADQALR